MIDPENSGNQVSIQTSVLNRFGEVGGEEILALY
jgi:hypothetical protein